jgi:hypothetical protein
MAARWLMCLVLACAALAADRVHPRDIDLLRFRAGAMTAGRAPVPQMVQRDGPDLGISEIVCRNGGWDGRQVMWKCDSVGAAAPHRLVAHEIAGEGYAGAGDEYWIAGSAQLEYSVYRTAAPAHEAAVPVGSCHNGVCTAPAAPATAPRSMPTPYVVPAPPRAAPPSDDAGIFSVAAGIVFLVVVAVAVVFLIAVCAAETRPRPAVITTTYAAPAPVDHGPAAPVVHTTHVHPAPVRHTTYVQPAPVHTTYVQPAASSFVQDMLVVNALTRPATTHHHHHAAPACQAAPAPAPVVVVTPVSAPAPVSYTSTSYAGTGRSRGGGGESSGGSAGSSGGFGATSFAGTGKSR